MPLPGGGETNSTAAPTPADIEAAVARALAEDVGDGDVTAAPIEATTQAHAAVISREPAIICGRAWFDAVFRQLDPVVTVEWALDDGARVVSDQTLCELHGPARAILTGERTALNFLQTLSATATQAQRFSEAIAGTGARILDTRKTLPGLRSAQKYAAHCGGAVNHRAGLYDGILIKENHLLVYGSIGEAVRQTRALTPGTPVEVEIEDLGQLDEALAAGADLVLLDNFDDDMLREAVGVTAGQARLEASGNVTLDTIRAIAETGVDYISVGAITKDIEAIDLSMRFAPV